MLEALIIVGNVVFVLVLVVGVLATWINLPGTALILANAVVYSACTHWQRPSIWALLGLACLVAVAETSDNLLSLVASRQGGATNRGGLAAMAGGIAGVVVGAWLAPLLSSIGLLGGIVGFLLGVVIVPLGLALLGGYLAAFWYEQHQGRTREEAIRAAKAALIGRLLGGMAKSILAIIMVAIILHTVF